MNDSARLERLFLQYYGVPVERMVRLAGAGSDRIYYRLTADGLSCIGVAGDSLRDAEAFVSLSQLLRGNGVNAPEVYAVDKENPRFYLQQDLGDSQLIAYFRERNADGSLSAEARSLAEDSLRQLARFQTIPMEDWEGMVAYKPFSMRQALWDLNYFKYEFLRPVGADFDEDALEDDFVSFAQRLVSVGEECSGLMYRDFQSRNVMIAENAPWLIDFQGARRGPSLYDAVSFLWQAKAGLSDEERMSLLETYREAYVGYRPDAERLFRPLLPMVAFRTLQVLGAYGFRGLVEHKAHFVESIPGALSTLAWLIKVGAFGQCIELEKACRSAISSPRLRDLPAPSAGKGPLRVDVYSFSYKKGYPEDLSGNGGGFMFDCRGMHNPGRYEEYRSLTGLDAPVRDFLRERGEADIFVSRCAEIVSPSVETYMRRGFSRLQIGFGCTGGQHRSVYCAQALGELLRARYPDAEVRIIHREQEGGAR